MKRPYPCTVCASRYQGAYEGGLWVAFPVAYWDVPDAAFGCDLSAAAFWTNADTVGRGATPDEAVQDMLRRL